MLGKFVGRIIVVSYLLIMMSCHMSIKQRHRLESTGRDLVVLHGKCDEMRVRRKVDCEATQEVKI
jgi:hypothetical protein